MQAQVIGSQFLNLIFKKLLNSITIVYVKSCIFLKICYQFYNLWYIGDIHAYSSACISSSFDVGGGGVISSTWTSLPFPQGLQLISCPVSLQLLVIIPYLSSLSPLLQSQVTFSQHLIHYRLAELAPYGSVEYWNSPVGSGYVYKLM